MVEGVAFQSPGNLLTSGSSTLAITYLTSPNPRSTFTGMTEASTRSRKLLVSPGKTEYQAALAAASLASFHW